MTYTKLCARCKVEQTLENSGLRPGKTYFWSYCRPCRNEITKEQVKRNPQKSAEKQKRATIKHRYGLTSEQYKELLSKGCAICGASDTLCIDHDHACCQGPNSCGKCIRGVLCNRHNKAFGFVKDSVEELKNMAEYLLRQDAKGAIIEAME